MALSSYSIRRGLVEQNQWILDICLEVVETKEQVSFPATLEEFSSMRNTIYRLLAATEALPREAGGKYYGRLKGNITPKYDAEKEELALVPSKNLLTQRDTLKETILGSVDKKVYDETLAELNEYTEKLRKEGKLPEPKEEKKESLTEMLRRNYGKKEDG